jgi:Ca-activated chloride channel family protein
MRFLSEQRVRAGGRWLWISLLVALALTLPLPAAAQIIIEPIPPVFPPLPPVPGPISITDHAVQAQVDGPVAVVKVSQVFHNDSGTVVEGMFVFPLPAEAAVSDFQMKVDGSVLEGRLLPADEARAIYEQIVRQRRDPALLQYLSGGLFQTNVFPIPPGETRTVQLTYTEVVSQQDGLYRFRYPLGAGMGGGMPEHPFRMEVDLVNQPGLRTLYSPNAGVHITRYGPDAAGIVWDGDTGATTGMVELYWGVADDSIGVNLLSYRPVEEDGYLALLLAPSIEVTGDAVVQRDLIVVLDVSGSMEGDKMGQARAAADYLVDHLNPGDRFNLISFSTGVRRWSNGLEEVTADNSADAHDWIARLEAGGSTDINRALLEALAMVEPAAGEGADRLTYILFLTDGLPTQGETDPWRIMDNATANQPDGSQVRLFPFGIGYDVNTILLDTLAKQMGGRSAYVAPDERIDEAVSQFYAGISVPVLAQVTAEFQGVAVVDDLYPYPLTDLFAGEQLVVTGRYREAGPVEVVLRGQVNGEPREYRYTDLGLRDRGGEPFVARLWASRKIGALMEQVRREGPTPEVVQAIVDLSLRYGIVTPYTAYLVEEPQAMAPVEGPMAPVPAAAGVGGGGAGGDAYAYAEDEAARQAAMPASGEAAVAASKSQNDMQTATTVGEATQARYVAGKTFVQQGWATTTDGAVVPFWVDVAYRPEMEMLWVAFGDEAYFSLAADPTMAQWLSLGPEIVVVDSQGTALRITTDAEEAARHPRVDPSVAPAAVPAATPTLPAEAPDAAASQNAWDAFWAWLWDQITPN